MPIVRNVINTVLACLFFLSIASFAKDHTVFYGKQIDAQRYTAVERGGYFPVLTELDNKDLVAVVRGGDRHMGVKGRLDWVRSTDGGKTWTLKTLAEGPMDHRNPAMGQLKDGSVLVAYEIDRSYGPNGESLKDRLTDGIYTLRSNDHGNTWKGPVQIAAPDGDLSFAFWEDRATARRHRIDECLFAENHARRFSGQYHPGLPFQGRRHDVGRPIGDRGKLQ